MDVELLSDVILILWGDLWLLSLFGWCMGGAKGSSKYFYLMVTSCWFPLPPSHPICSQHISTTFDTRKATHNLDDELHISNNYGSVLQGNNMLYPQYKSKASTKYKTATAV